MNMACGWFYMVVGSLEQIDISLRRKKYRTQDYASSSLRFLSNGEMLTQTANLTLY